MSRSQPYSCENIKSMLQISFTNFRFYPKKMFKCVTKKVVEFLGESDGLLPNENHYESEKLKLTALVEMKKKKYFFQSDKYYPKEILLHHVSEEQDLNKVINYCYNDIIVSLYYV